MQMSLEQTLDSVREKDPHQPEFHQAVEEVLSTLWPFIEKCKDYQKQGLIERFVEPERIIQFRVPWVDDAGKVHVNRGYRVQMNSAIGPYKGGLRFHPSVNLSVLKFLAFEQVLKNSLTTLPLGGGKGGADFDPKGKSDNEVMRFCQAFMTELYRHIGPETDVPAGDIGVGGREVGYMYGMYRKLRNEVTGTFTGKGLSYGGSILRPEATGYGLIYFVEAMLKTKNKEIAGQKLAISGSGNVAQFTAHKAIELDALVVTMSDSDGVVHNPDGFTMEQWQYLMELKNERRGRISELAKKFNLKFEEGAKPWQYRCDIALPCATQNELDVDDAKTLLDNGCFCISEGANMPLTLEAIHTVQEARILYAPGKASNAGGVAVSGLEMAQNSMRQHWSEAEVDNRLHTIMSCIHKACVSYGKEDEGEYTDYVTGANIAGFVKVADAMLAQGVV
ncbi:NADP-specific glutamate dehydrogenase [Allohahella marinimesophila]|uniref:Glutamate dehydrogenase n=1 Tax=Allohahella marinimesophila TaxID=1054972 RepID=A0ABP7P168_9GAMM